jgi:hypothetical protein
MYNKNLPKNFDWKYYLSIHPDLINAEILNENQAIIHYLSHGKYEQREYYSQNKTYPLSHYILDAPEDNKIIVFLQWYLDESTEWDRFKCILKNIDNEHIDKIHIFYEKNSEDNLKSKPAHWEKVSTSPIEERLTYKYWIDYSSKHYPEYIKILTNSDIYLLDSIKTLKSCKFDNTKMYVLTRKDQTKEGDIVNSKELYEENSIEINHIYSQDCWIFKDNLKNINKINTNLFLGYENCDRILKNNLVYNNIDFVNLYPDIFCVHIDYRESKERPKYNLNFEQENVILLTKDIKWQHPATTEKDAYFKHLYMNSQDPSNIYIGFPWASLIDNATVHGKDTKDVFDTLTKTELKIQKIEDKNIHTVCQHIHWDRIVPICKKLKITDLYVSHYKKETPNIENIRIHPWKLTASNFKHSNIQYNLYDKKYLFSFIGSVTIAHKSQIRYQLKDYCENLKSEKYPFIYELTDKWFYQKYVFDYQTKNMSWTYQDHQALEAQQKRYNEILSNSIFSLCPEGAGPNTLRVWESLSVGVIPVIYSDTWEPPKLNKYEWESFSIRIPMNEYSKTLDILLSITPEQIKNMQMNALNAYKTFNELICFY